MEKPNTKKLIEAMLFECKQKHLMNPFEDNLSPDWHVELTFSVQEIRDFLIENGNLFDYQKVLTEANIL